MQRRTVGVMLLFISAFLYGIRYISAAIFGSNISSWNIELFNAMLEYVGSGPLILSRIAFFGGIGYLIFAEFESIIAKNMKKIKDESFIAKNMKEIKDNWNDFDSGKG